MLKPVSCFTNISRAKNADISTSPSHLVFFCRSLTCLQLIQVPSTNAHVATLLIHALPEAPNIVFTRGRSLLLGIGVLAVVVRSRGFLLLLLGRSLRRAATEETADGVADGRAYGDTAAR